MFFDYDRCLKWAEMNHIKNEMDKTSQIKGRVIAAVLFDFDSCLKWTRWKRKSYRSCTPQLLQELPEVGKIEKDKLMLLCSSFRTVV